MAWYDGSDEGATPKFARGNMVVIIGLATRGHVIAITRSGFVMPRRYAIETMQGELHFCTADELRPAGRAGGGRHPRIVCIDGIRVDD